MNFDFKSWQHNTLDAYLLFQMVDTGYYCRIPISSTYKAYIPVFFFCPLYFFLGKNTVYSNNTEKQTHYCSLLSQKHKPNLVKWQIITYIICKDRRLIGYSSKRPFLGAPYCLTRVATLNDHAPFQPSPPFWLHQIRWILIESNPSLFFIHGDSK